MSSARRFVGPALWVVGGALLALAWLSPDLISSWRARSAPYASMSEGCDPTRQLCSAVFDDGLRVELSVDTSTQPERRRAFDFTVRAPEGVAPTHVDLSGINMMSGLFRLPLEPSDGDWSASTHLPRCTMKKMLWRAEVILPDRTARFAFEAFNPGGKPNPRDEASP